MRQVNGIQVLVKEVAVDTPAALRELADRYRDRVSSGIVVLGSAAQDKALLIVIVSKDLVQRFHAGRIVKTTFRHGRRQRRRTARHGPSRRQPTAEPACCT